MTAEPLNAPMIRKTKADDVPALKAIIEATGLFAADLLDGMIEPFFRETPGGERWLTAVDADVPAGVAYFVQERMAQGTWNLLLIAVHPDFQRRGIGAALMNFIEGGLIVNGERILIVETSGLAAFEGTRAFYQRIGYDEEARIRDFYKAGDDKVIFRRSLR